jgi:hypothetical protein
MKLQRVLVPAVTLLVILFSVNAVPAWGAEQTETIKGYVIDSACTFVKNLKNPASPECAVACAKAGSPLVILAENGVIYWPISDATPATSQNGRLTEFAGKKVSVTGKVYSRGGSHAIVIGKIEAAPAGK